MSIPYRIDGPNDIDVKNLLLWPNNPRLKISDFREVKYTVKQLLEPSNQKKIFDLLSKHEDHDVITLIRSMCKSGFMREKAPVVIKIKGVDRFLVLEGNRRLTAIKTILENSSIDISASNRATLERIPCWLFRHTSKKVPLKAAISRMVAEAHIKGQKPHTKLQRAHMLYDAYEGFLIDKNPEANFTLDRNALRSTAEFFDMPEKDLEAEISVVRLYKQFVSAFDYENIPAKCSERLSWIHKNSRQFGAHFGYDPKSLSLDTDGMERFYDVFLAKEAAVQNPQSFKKFLNIMRDGAPEDIDIVRYEPEQLSEIEKRIKEEKIDNRFLSGLEVIERRIKSLRIADFNRSKDEANVIRRIISLVDQKLRRLESGVSEAAGNYSSPLEQFVTPKSIDEAILLDYLHLSDQIEKIVKAQPYSSCMREKVPTCLLKQWGIRSRGKPREAFCRHTDDALLRMVEEGRLDLYQSKNERVRVF